MASHVFGPVPSRRLGRSLGVDLIPFKTCSYDCVYCQLGRTTTKTVERSGYYEMAEVLAELEGKLKSGPRPDVITLSGSGEPTLYAGLGELIDGFHTLTDVPVVVLTNGSLLSRDDVRSDVLRADVVVPSLDAGDRETFEKVNRPHGDVDFDEMVRGLIAFGREFRGKLFLEVLFVKGINDSEASVRRIADLAQQVKPERVQLNTVVRPPADVDVEPVSPEDLHRFAEIFGGDAEVIASFEKPHDLSEFSIDESALLEMVARRPCTIVDIADGLGAHVNEVVKVVEAMLTANRLTPERVEDRTYYRPAS